VNSDDYYKVLGVPKDADLDQIKKAYKKLAIKYHPDKNPDDKSAEETFKKVGEAYGVLSDKDKRAEYDQFGKVQPGQAMPGGFNGFGGGGRGMSQEEARQMFSQMFGSDDPFAAFFGGGMSGMGGGMGGMGGGRRGRGVQFNFGGSPFGGSSFGGSPFGGFGGGMDGFDHFGRRGGGGFPQGAKAGRGGSTIGKMEPGTRIIAKNLRKTPELNGEMGTVIEYDPSSKRYICQIEDIEYKLKRENIQQIVDDVEINGLTGNPELNGAMGTLFDRNLSTDRYNIRVARGGSAAVKPANVILPVGTSVLVVGLQNGVQYNDKEASISEIDRSQRRYVVDIPTNSGVEHLRIKWENVRA